MPCEMRGVLITGSGDVRTGLIPHCLGWRHLCLHQCHHPEHHHHKRSCDFTMAQAGKENIADGLIANGSFKASTQPLKKAALSPKKKTRSKSIGPGGLGELEAPPLKEAAGNRRKVCVMYANTRGYGID